MILSTDIDLKELAQRVLVASKATACSRLSVGYCYQWNGSTTAPRAATEFISLCHPASVCPSDIRSLTSVSKLCQGGQFYLQTTAFHLTDSIVKQI